MNIREAAQAAQKTAILLAACGKDVKNQALERIARALGERKDEIIRANREDLARSERENLAAPC